MLRACDKNIFFSAHDLHEGTTTMIVCFKVSSEDEIGTHHQKL